MALAIGINLIVFSKYAVVLRPGFEKLHVLFVANFSTKIVLCVTVTELKPYFDKYQRHIGCPGGHT